MPCRAGPPHASSPENPGSNLALGRSATLRRKTWQKPALFYRTRPAPGTDTPRPRGRRTETTSPRSAPRTPGPPAPAPLRAARSGESRMEQQAPIPQSGAHPGTFRQSTWPLPTPAPRAMPPRAALSPNGITSSQ